jgi:hypothetical protein
MGQRSLYKKAVFRKGKYLLSLSLLFSIITLFENCYRVDDDDINAVCPRDCTTIKGRFVTKDGNVPVSNMRLHFEFFAGNMSGFASFTRKIATTTTDENGNFLISFYARDNEIRDAPGWYSSYQLRFDVPDITYLTRPNSDHIGARIDKRDTTVVLNYQLPILKSFIRIKFVNPEAIGEDESLQCRFRYIAGDTTARFAGYWHGSELSTSWTPHTTDSTFTTASDQYTYLEVAKRKNGEYSRYQDSVLIAPNQLLEYDVTF